MIYTRYSASRFIYLLEHDFRMIDLWIFVEKMEQPEMCKKERSASKQTSHSCCDLRRHDVWLHFWRGAHQGYAVPFGVDSVQKYKLE